MSAEKNKNRKVVLITGGATGIGRAIAVEFAKRGFLVIVNYNKSIAEAEFTLKKIKRMGGNALKMRTDITDNNEVKRMFSIINQKFGHLDILVNNAGWTKFIDYKHIKQLNENIYNKIMHTNVKGMFLCSQQAKKLMSNVKEALIINISSTSGFSGIGSNIVYCASKAAVINMTKSLALALAPNIRVNSIAPGFTNTKFISWVSKKNLDKEKRMTPLKRIAQPRDIAKVAVALYEDMQFVNGQTIVIDGGRSLQNT